MRILSQLPELRTSLEPEVLYAHLMSAALGLMSASIADSSQFFVDLQNAMKDIPFPLSPRV